MPYVAGPRCLMPGQTRGLQHRTTRKCGTRTTSGSGPRGWRAGSDRAMRPAFRSAGRIAFHIALFSRTWTAFSGILSVQEVHSCKLPLVSLVYSFFTTMGNMSDSCKPPHSWLKFQERFLFLERVVAMRSRGQPVRLHALQITRPFCCPADTSILAHSCRPLSEFIPPI